MTTRPTPAGLNTLRTVHQTLRGEVNNLAGQRGINSHTFRKLLADGFLSQVDPCPACAPEDVDVFAPGHPCERPLPGKHGNKCHGRMRMTAAAYEALGEPVPAKLHDVEQDIAQMHPEDVAGRARVVGAQLDQAAASTDVKPAPIPAPAGAGEPAADLLDLLAEMLRAADVMTPAEVERSTGRVRNPEKCLSVPLALREPRFGALSPALVDALARREPADGPVYAVMAHVQSALVGPFASPAEARDWWAADFNKLAARARFVLVPARCVDCDDQAVTVGQPFHVAPEGRPGPECGRHAGPARRLSGLPVPPADVECVDGPRLVDEINLRAIAASMGIPLPLAETVRVGALVVDEQAGTATPALAELPDVDAYEVAQQATRDRYWTDGCGADVLARDAELGATEQLTLDVPAPAGWRQPRTMAETVDLFPAGRDVQHLNPALSDWLGVVEPMPRAGRHIEDGPNGPNVRVRWFATGDQAETVGFYSAATIEPAPLAVPAGAGEPDADVTRRRALSVAEAKVRDDLASGSVNPAADPAWVAARDVAGQMTDAEAAAYYNALASQQPVTLDDDPDAGYDDPPLPPGFVPELGARVGIVVPLPATDDEVAAALARAASLPAGVPPPAPSGRRAARFLDETYRPVGRAVPST